MMDIPVFLTTLSSASNPLLPPATLMGVALVVIWAVVLGSGSLLLTRKLARPYQLGLALLVVLLTLYSKPPDHVVARPKNVSSWRSSNWLPFCSP